MTPLTMETRLAYLDSLAKESATISARLAEIQAERKVLQLEARAELKAVFNQIKRQPKAKP